MTKQIINIGTPDKGNGDPLRVAFDKVNQNFTELYNALGLTDNNLNLGSFEFNDNVMTTTDSSSIIIDQATTITSDLTVGGNLLPNSNLGGDIGSPERQWRSLYVSNSTIYLNNVPLNLDVENNLTVDGKPLAKFDENGNLNVSNSIQFWDSSVQETAYRFTASTTAPVLTTGALWFNTDEGKLYVNYNNTWVDANPTEIDPSAIRYNNQNQIELPEGGDIVDVNGDSVLGANTGNIEFRNDSMNDVNGIIITNASQLTADTARITIPANGSGNVSITNNDNNWIFGTTGILTVPAVNSENLFIQGSEIGSTNSGIAVTATNNIVLTTDALGTPKFWQFGTDGILTLPNDGKLYSNNPEIIQLIPNTEKETFIALRSDGIENERVTIATYAGVWEFLPGGVLDFNIGLKIAPLSNYSPSDGTMIIQNTNESVHILTPGNDAHLLLGWTSTNGLKTATIGFNADSDALEGVKITTGNPSGGFHGWVFGADGDLRLPDGGIVKDYLGNNIVPSNLSNFNNDLEINADSLTGDTLADNVNFSTLQTVGTLQGLTSSGIVHITNTQDSINADTGALQVDGGAHITKNLIAEGTIYAGVDAYSEALTNPLIVASSPSGVEGGYSQVAILNNTATASGDFQVMIDGYDVNVSDTGWADLGMAGSNFSDPRYTITQPGDGYVFVSGKESSTNRGSLVLATDGSGTINDIVFATGGFLTANEKMRLKNSDGSLDIASGLITSSGPISITANGHSLSIGNNGNITVPAPIYWTNTNVLTWNPYIAWDDDDNFFIVNSPSSFKIRTSADGVGTPPVWTFDANGTINLPVGGDIKDSSGNSVFQSTYTLPTATTSVLGGVKVDGSTIIIVDGVISATGAGGGGYSLPTATTSVLGGVKIDGTTITIDGSGVISAAIPTNISTFTNDAGYLTSVTTITGNAGTATKLATARNINGVAFDGTGDITITAAAGTLTGNTLNAGVTQSSLTSVGTLTNLTVTNPISGSVTGSAGSVAGTNITGTTLASGITSSSLTSVGTLVDLTVTNPISGSVTGSAGSVAASALTGSTLASGVTASSLTSVGTLTSLTVGGTLTRTGAVSAAAWGTGGIGLRITNATYTDTSSTGTLSTSNIHYVGQPTLAFSSATTVAQANTLYISNAPAAGTNATITAGYALNVAAGNSYFASNVRVGGYLQSAGGASILYLSNSAAQINGDLTLIGSGNITTPGSISRSGNINAASWGSAGISLKLGAGTFTDTSSSGTLAAQYINTISTPTMAFTNATTVTNAATLYVSQPTAGTNATFTNSYAILTNGNARIDGNLTLPNLPGFRVYGSGTTNNLGTTVNTNGILNSNNYAVDYNQGSHLNASTGVFTAPVAGLYSIHLNARVTSNTATASQVTVTKNYATSNTILVMWEHAANPTVNHFGVSTVAKLAVGDTLVVKVTQGSINFDGNDSWAVAFLG